MAKCSKSTAKETSESADAESGKASKAELIRQTAKELGKRFRPRDIVAAMKAKGIEVGYTQIAKALRAGGFRRRGRRKAGASSASNNGAADPGKVNKAQRIRETAKAMGRKVRPKDIITELAKEGIHVSSAQVSTTLTAAGYRRRGLRGRARAAARATAGHGLDLEALIATKALVQKIGGIEMAEEAAASAKRLG